MSESLIALLVATLGGAAVGVERQWSGHATGPGARFAGVRTFALLGAAGGLAGRFWVWEAPLLAAVLLLGTGALVIAAYVAASRHDVDATTEAAALVVIGAGGAAGLGQLGVASGVVAVTALLLFEKSRLHDLIARVQGSELNAAFRFAVMAVVVLPVLPEGPVAGPLAVRPRELWTLVLFFSGLSFLGYLAERSVGASRGLTLAGLLGGIVSSTSVTLAFARYSRTHPALAGPLAQGVIAANTVLYVRVLLAASVLSPPLARELWPLLAAPLLAGLAAALSGFWRRDPEEDGPGGLARNPLQLRSALEMAALFQVGLVGVSALGERFGTGGLLATAALLGLTDTDALTLSIAREARESAVAMELAAMAVTVGVLSNTAVKLALALAVGRGPFRPRAAGVLLAMAILLAGAVALLFSR